MLYILLLAVLTISRKKQDLEVVVYENNGPVVTEYLNTYY
jgi:hypothetical protein